MFLRERRHLQVQKNWSWHECNILFHWKQNNHNQSLSFFLVNQRVWTTVQKIMIPNLVFNLMESNVYLGSPSSIGFRKNIWRDLFQLQKKFSECGYAEPAFSTKAGDYVWQMDPVWLVMKGSTLVPTEQSFSTFQDARGRWHILGGSLGFRCAPCHLAVWQKAFLVTTGHRNTYLLVPKTSCSSPNPCSFWQYVSCHSPDILIGCLLRCPLQWFMDSPPPLVKMTFVKIYFFLLGTGQVTMAFTLK